MAGPSTPGWPWAAAIAFAAVAGSLATACMMPFVAVAVMAAATLPVRQAATTVLTAWLANQLLGFGLLGYPLSGYALGWGVALGAGSLVALFAARLAGVREGVPLLQLVGAALFAFAAYEVALFGYALVAGGQGTFTPHIIALLAKNEGVWLVGLFAFHQLLGRAAPRWFGQLPALRLA